MQILLTTLNAKYIHLNLAIRLLYEMNKNHEGLNWKEFTIKENSNEIASYCAQYEIVAFSCYIWNITQTLEVVKRIKSLNPQTKILLGGPEVSYDFEDVIDLESVDYIITGEGEIPFQEFINSYPNIKNVPNLIWKNEGKIIKNLPLEKVFDLNNFQNSNPYQFDPVNELKTKVLYIETSRGCPYKCEFCLASLDNKMRYLPIETIQTHLKYLMENGKTIKFLDRTFNIKKDFTISIFQYILDNYKPGNIFQFEITADIIHPDIVKFIQENVPEGLFRFEIGIQTVNQKANLEVSRKQNFEKTKAIIKSLSNKIEMHLDLIVGLALDYWDDIKFSIEEVFKLFAPELQLGFLKFLKGTPMRDKLEVHGFKFDPNPPYQIIESNYLSKEQLHQITLLEHALEIYWNKKRAANTLKYIALNYSIFDFLLGLGTFFGQKRSFWDYKFDDVYLILEEYVQNEYNFDPIIKELLAVDYYIHHKVKPKPMIMNDLDKKVKFELLISKKLNHSKFRYVVLPLNFDFSEFEKHERIEKKNYNLIIQYDGQKKADLILN